jgi:hypothetical protein
MNEKRKIRGLLDILVAEANDEGWELEEPSAGFMPGMGLGATEQARRWAFIGFTAELMRGIDAHPKRPVGQPKKQCRFSNDAKRAVVIYVTLERHRSHRGIDRNMKIELSLTELIAKAQKLFPEYEIFDKPTYGNKMYASVKRGRKIFGIDKYWRGPDLGSLFNIE